MCGMFENLEGGLLVQCDTCNKWAHSRCYNLDENIISKDDYDFYCVACKPRPELTLSIPATTNSKTKNLSTPPENNTAATLEAIIRRVSTLEADLEATKERLEDQKAQHKSQCRVLQSQILSLEEQNSLLERKIHELSQTQSTRRNRGREPLQPNHRPNSIPSTDIGPTQPAIQARTTRNPPAVHTPSQNTHHRDPPPSQPQFFRIIWGTRKSCSVEDVRTSLTQLAPSISQTPTIKRSFRRLGPRKAWWFTVIFSSPGEIALLDEAWESNKSAVDWALLKSLKDRPSRWHSSPDTATTPTPQQNPPNSAPFQQATQYSHLAAPMAPLPAPWPSQRSLPVPDSSKCVNLPSNPSNYPPGKPAPLPPISHTSQVPAPQFTQTLRVTSGQHTLPYPPSSHSTTPPQCPILTLITTPKLQ